MRYALRRAGQAAIVLIAAFTATFFLLQMLPGDAILIKFDNPELGLSPEQIEPHPRVATAPTCRGGSSTCTTLAGLRARRLRVLDPVRHAGARDHRRGAAGDGRARRARVPRRRAPRRRSSRSSRRSRRSRGCATALRALPGALRLGAGVLARHPAHPGLLVRARLGADRRGGSRPGADPAGAHARGPDLGAARADPGAQHRRGAAAAVRRRSCAPRAPPRRGCCGTRSRATRSCRR